MTTDVTQFFHELDGGVFAEKLGQALHDVAHGAVDFDGEGKITIAQGFKQIGSGYQVKISHKLTATIPTLRGKITEEETTETPMHVGKNGPSYFPENQGQMLDLRGNVKDPTDAEK